MCIRDRDIMNRSVSGPEFVGTVNVSDMLYGKPIRGKVVSVRSINENSGRIIFTGKAFACDEREITSKKNEKTYHLVTIDVTDKTDSVTVKMFITKSEDDEAFTRFFGRIKKGIKGGGIYLSLIHI